jgi:hypothetical protein
LEILNLKIKKKTHYYKLLDFLINKLKILFEKRKFSFKQSLIYKNYYYLGDVIYNNFWFLKFLKIFMKKTGQKIFIINFVYLLLKLLKFYYGKTFLNVILKFILFLKMDFILRNFPKRSPFIRRDEKTAIPFVLNEFAAYRIPLRMFTLQCQQLDGKNLVWPLFIVGEEFNLNWGSMILMSAFFTNSANLQVPSASLLTRALRLAAFKVALSRIVIKNRQFLHYRWTL